MQEIKKTFATDYPKGCKTPEAKAAYDLVKGKTFLANVDLFSELADKPTERLAKLQEKYGVGKVVAATVASLVIDFQAIMKRTAEAKKGVVSKEELTKVLAEFDFSAPVKRVGGGRTAKPKTADDVNRDMQTVMAGMSKEQAEAFVKQMADSLRQQLAAKASQK